MSEIELLFRKSGGVLAIRDLPVRLASVLYRLKRVGSVIALLPGVYVPSSIAGDTDVRILAAARWAPEAVLTGDAALRLTVDQSRPCPVVTLVGKSRRRVPPGFAYRRVRRLPGEVRIAHSGLPVLVPAAAAVLLADADQGAAIDLVLRTRRARPEDIETAHRELPRLRGNPARARVVSRSRSNPWSFAERGLHDGLDRHRVTGWRANVRCLVNGRTYILDAWFERARLVVEVDGYTEHSKRETFARDRVKQADLTMAGFRVLRFTAEMVINRVDECVATIQACLSGREAPAVFPGPRAA